MMYTNEYYDLDYERTKNQITWKVKGFWRSVDIVPDLEQHWESILDQVQKPGFTVLADMTEMKAAPPAVEALHMSIQERLRALGVNKVATIVSKSAIAAMAGKRIGKKTEFDRIARNFSDRTEAQAWLDEG